MKQNTQTGFTARRRIFFWLIALAIFARLSSSESHGATFAVDVAAHGQLQFSPSSISIQVGDTVTWNWRASGHSVTSGTPGSPNGLFDSGIKNSGTTFAHTFTAAGSFGYFCMPHGLCCGMTGTVNVSAPPPTPTPSPVADPAVAAQPLNISTRLDVRTDDHVAIAGFVIDGTEPKRVLLRGIGPSLSDVGILNPLADPFLELHGSDRLLITTNDNWNDPPQPDVEATGLAPTNNLESAILITLDPGSYTAIMRGNAEGIGVGLIDAFDLDPTADSTFANISTRGFAETGDQVMIGGFTLGGGGGSATIVVRAIGPSLAQLGVKDVLTDPTLEVRDKDGNTLNFDDNWKDSQKAEIQAAGKEPENDLESAILLTLLPDSYTAIVAGKDGTTGVALVEVYRIPDPGAASK
jgi:plastocyanin